MADIKKSKTKPVDLQLEVAALKDQLSRSLADYDNLQKRVESQRQLFVALATTSLISKFIDVLDDFELIYHHLPDPGLKMALDKFRQSLKSEGLEEVNPLGHQFQPQTMECIDTKEGEENKVISVKKPGYFLNGHCLRPAKVVVGKAKSHQSQTINN